MKNRFPAVYQRSFFKALALLLLALSGASSPEADAAPLRVYILCGQSNMQGHARTTTFEHIGMDPATAPLLDAMTDGEGNPRVCERVWISYLSQDREKTGKLTAGFGADDDKIGPEFTFGLTLEQNLPEPILLIKTAWGGKSLHTDFRPPSAGPYVFSEQQLENLQERGKDLATFREEKRRATGHYYRLTIEHVKEVLADLGAVVPGHDPDQGYELAGFVWFQGWNDMVDSGVYPNRDKPGGYAAYSEVMGHFIRDVRQDLDAPGLPFVIGVMGVGGPVSEYGPDRQRYASTHQNFRDAMAAPALRPEFRGNVFPVLTETYWDRQLQDLTARDDRIKRTARQITQAKEKPQQATAEILAQLRAEEFSAEEREILSSAISNQAYHYLGAGKIMAQIGRAFAEPLLESGRNPSR